jgi:predicted nucleic acid-binding protein
MITHLLDTSAILAHYFNSAGAGEVDTLWRDPANVIGLSVLTLVELHGRLAATVADAAERERIFHLYADELAVVVDVDDAVARYAGEYRAAAPAGLPLADAVIAATARAENAVLVHRDPHFAALGAAAPRQLILPDQP